MEKSEVPRICEDHFTLDSFETTEDEEAHKVLMPDAIPTLKLKLDKPPTEENDSKPTEIDNGSENAKDGIFETDLIEKEKCCIPSCKSPGVVFHRFPQGLFECFYSKVDKTSKIRPTYRIFLISIPPLNTPPPPLFFPQNIFKSAHKI